MPRSHLAVATVVATVLIGLFLALARGGPMAAPSSAPEATPDGATTEPDGHRAVEPLELAGEREHVAPPTRGDAASPSTGTVRRPRHSTGPLPEVPDIARSPEGLYMRLATRLGHDPDSKAGRRLFAWIHERARLRAGLTDDGARSLAPADVAIWNAGMRRLHAKAGEFAEPADLAEVLCALPLEIRDATGRVAARLDALGAERPSAAGERNAAREQEER